MAFVGRAVPHNRRIRLDPLADAGEPADLRSGSSARSFVSRRGVGVPDRFVIATLLLFSLVMFGLAFLIVNRRSQKAAA